MAMHNKTGREAPDALIDITHFFSPSVTVADMRDGNTYACCCRGDKEKSEDDSIVCALKDITQPNVIKYKTGCGGLMGLTYHAWHRMPTLPLHANRVNAGRCVVPQSEELARLLPSAPRGSRFPVTDGGLLDLTTLFVDENDAKNKHMMLNGGAYLCCCRRMQDDADHTYVLCELTDTNREKVVSDKSDCGGYAGSHFHSWLNFPEQSCLVAEEDIPAELQ